jgi:hypothetical protein
MKIENMRLEGCLTVENKFGVERTIIALRTLDDEIQRRSNKHKLKSNISTT